MNKVHDIYLITCLKLSFNLHIYFQRFEDLLCLAHRDDVGTPDGDLLNQQKLFPALRRSICKHRSELKVIQAVMPWLRLEASLQRFQISLPRIQHECNIESEPGLRERRFARHRMSLQHLLDQRMHSWADGCDRMQEHNLKMHASTQMVITDQKVYHSNGLVLETSAASRLLDQVVA